MTGLDIMLSQLQAEAKAEADSRLAAAREEADQLLAQADAEAESGAELIARQAEEEAARHLERTRSSADRKRRMILLQAKQEVIAEVLKKAYEKMDSLEDGAYFDLIRRLLRECAQPLEGEIRFSERDRKRFPAGFEKEIGKIAAERGGSLRLEDNAAIDNGFILAYGGVEENCTFRAMFDSRKEALQDAARRVLFS